MNNQKPDTMKTINSTAQKRRSHPIANASGIHGTKDLSGKFPELQLPKVTEADALRSLAWSRQHLRSETALKGSGTPAGQSAVQMTQVQRSKRAASRRLIDQKIRYTRKLLAACPAGSAATPCTGSVPQSLPTGSQSLPKHQ